jgi:aspartate aminotransferase-like enzyme
VMLQAGQGAMTAQILRVGHMGWTTEEDLSVAFDALESTLALEQFQTV